MALICHCRRVSDRQVLAEVQAGACCLADVQERCGAATRCGGCLGAIESLVAKATVELAGAAV
jgi:bacterioferritin-associated ferredoxin